MMLFPGKLSDKTVLIHCIYKAVLENTNMENKGALIRDYMWGPMTASIIWFYLL